MSLGRDVRLALVKGQLLEATTEITSAARWLDDNDMDPAMAAEIRRANDQLIEIRARLCNETAAPSSPPVQEAVELLTEAGYLIVSPEHPAAARPMPAPVVRSTHDNPRPPAEPPRCTSCRSILVTKGTP